MRSVAIVEDHQLLAETLLATLLDRGVDAEIVELCEPADLLAALQERRPRLVMLDLDLGGFGDSTWLIEPLASDGIRVLVVTGSSNRLRIATALEQGAIGYQLKSAGFDALVSRVELATTSDGVLDPAERTQMLHELSVARIERARRLEPFGRLTDRERLTLQALAQGRTVHEIARDWQLSEATVRTHVRSVLAKLKAPSQLAAVSIALRSGWLDNAAQVAGTATSGAPLRAGETDPPHPMRRATDVFAG